MQRVLVTKPDPHLSKTWRPRHLDPALKMKWGAAIQVSPANHEKRIRMGFTTYPDGAVERFEVNGA